MTEDEDANVVDLDAYRARKLQRQIQARIDSGETRINVTVPNGLVVDWSGGAGVKVYPTGSIAGGDGGR